MEPKTSNALTGLDELVAALIAKTKNDEIRCRLEIDVRADRMREMTAVDIRITRDGTVQSTTFAIPHSVPPGVLGAASAHGIRRSCAMLVEEINPRTLPD